MVKVVGDWPWSSYRAIAGMVEPIKALTTDWVLGNFSSQRARASIKYRDFVAEGKAQPSPWQYLKNQVFLGTDEFVEEAQSKLRADQSLEDIPKPQKLAPIKPLDYYVSHYVEKEGMARAYLSGHYTLADVGRAYSKSYTTVSRAVKKFEELNSGCRSGIG
jgi:hypothetical protein